MCLSPKERACEGGELLLLGLLGLQELGLAAYVNCAPWLCSTPGRSLSTEWIFSGTKDCRISRYMGLG